MFQPLLVTMLEGASKSPKLQQPTLKLAFEASQIKQQ